MYLRYSKCHGHIQHFTSPGNITILPGNRRLPDKQATKPPTKQNHQSSSISTPYKTFFHVLTIQSAWKSLIADFKNRFAPDALEATWNGVWRKHSTSCAAQDELGQSSQIQAQYWERCPEWPHEIAVLPLFAHNRVCKQTEVTQMVPFLFIIGWGVWNPKCS